jgi:hypothetical protein
MPCNEHETSWQGCTISLGARARCCASPALFPAFKDLIFFVRHSERRPSPGSTSSQAPLMSGLQAPGGGAPAISYSGDNRAA